MSQTTKIVLGIVLAVIVLGGAYYYWQTKEQSTGSLEKAEVTTLPSGTNKSDTALENDLGSIDAQIQAVGTDNSTTRTSIDTVSTQ